MSDNVERVRQFFTTLSAGELEALRAMLHPQATWEAMARSIPGAGVNRGRDVIIDEFLGPVRGLFHPGEPKIEVRNVIGSGDFAMAETRAVGTLHNGRSYDNVYAWAFEFKEGLVLAIREYMDGGYIQSVLAP